MRDRRERKRRLAAYSRPFLYNYAVPSFLRGASVRTSVAEACPETLGYPLYKDRLSPRREAHSDTEAEQAHFAGVGSLCGTNLRSLGRQNPVYAPRSA